MLLGLISRCVQFWLWYSTNACKITYATVPIVDNDNDNYNDKRSLKCEVELPISFSSGFTPKSIWSSRVPLLKYSKTKQSEPVKGLIYAS